MTQGSFMMSVEDIIINRERRQRRELLNIDAMEQSLKSHGQIQPIVIDEKGELVAGERRLTAAKNLGWKEIEVKRRTDLSQIEAQLIELEENVQRNELSWQDECRATRAIHELMRQQNPEVTQEVVAEHLGLTQSTLAGRISVASALDGEDAEVINNHASWRSAYSYINRAVSRAADAALDDLLAPTSKLPTPQVDDTIDKLGAAAVIADLDSGKVEVVVPPADFRIECKNSLDWMASYIGPRFNLLHCDFPYGIDHGESDQGGAARHGAYEDSADIYFALLEGLLAYKDKVLANSCHILFWFSMNHYGTTKQLFENAGFVVNPMPLLWFKQDNTGIIPDAQRGPRQVYETAFLISRGDRKIVRPVSNVCAHPGRKTEMIHISEKPEEMLGHFFNMLVDRTTTMLDLTCGSGTSVRAAFAAGAASALGLELDGEMVKRAQCKLNATLRGSNESE